MISSIVLVATFLAVLTSVQAQCNTCSQCTFSDIHKCFLPYGAYNAYAGGYDVPIDTQCSLFQEEQECLEGVSSKCPASVWALFASNIKGRNSVKTTYCSNAYKPVYQASEPCFAQYLDQYINCYNDFNNVNPFSMVNPTDAVAHSIPCCRGLAELYCNAKVYVPNCPGAASLLQTVASLFKENTITSCAKSSLLTSCCSATTLANVLSFLNINIDLNVLGLGANVGLNLGLGNLGLNLNLGLGK